MLLSPQWKADRRPYEICQGQYNGSNGEGGMGRCRPLFHNEESIDCPPLMCIYFKSSLLLAADFLFFSHFLFLTITTIPLSFALFLVQMSSSSDIMNEYLKNYMRNYFERHLLKKVLPKEPATIAFEHEDGSDDTSSGEEGDDSDPQSSESDSSDDETEAGSSSDEAENQRTLENLKSTNPEPKFDPKSASRDNELESDADSKRIPSKYKMQPIHKGSASSSKRSRNEIDGDLSRRCQRSRIEEKKSVSTPPGVGGVGCNAVELNEPMEERLGTQAARWKAMAKAQSSASRGEIRADAKIAGYITLYNFYKLYVTETEERVKKDLCRTINKMKKNLGLDSDDDDA